jgi:hypothetical protein
MVLADWPVLIPGYLNPTLPTAVLFAHLTPAERTSSISTVA